jgi:hypothetical protein
MFLFRQIARANDQTKECISIADRVGIEGENLMRLQIITNSGTAHGRRFFYLK